VTTRVLTPSSTLEAIPMNADFLEITSLPAQSGIISDLMAAADPALFEPLLSVEEAAETLGGIHVKTAQKWARAHILPAYQIGRQWFFRASELNTWLLNNAKMTQANTPA
jgi:excisionase family DNA binding protein